MGRPRKEESRQIAIPAIWYKNCRSPEEKEAVMGMLRGSNALFDLLNEILRSQKLDVEARRLSLGAFDKPAWAYYQAELNGEERCLKSLQALIPTEQG